MRFNMKKINVKFSVPFNGDPELVDFLLDNKRFINDIYFGMPHNLLPSGRIIEYNEKSENYLSNLIKSLKTLKENKIICNLAMNSACEGEKIFSRDTLNKYKYFISEFVKDDLIKGVILSNPVYIKELKKEFPNLIFSISINANINSVYRAKYADKMGFNTITIDRDINHNKELIKRISKNVSAKIKVLVNECCLNECLFRSFHFNLMSHHKKDIDYKKRIPCVEIYSKEPWDMLKSSFILPKDLKGYEGFVDVFKIAGRNLPTRILKYLLKSYFYRKKKGDLLAILSCYGLFTWKDEFIKKNNKIPYLEMNKLPENFRKIISNCNFNCKKCNYCKNIWDYCLTNY